MSLALERQILLSALSEPIGLLIRASPIDLVKARLYRARAASLGDFDEIQIRTSPFEEGDLVLVRRTPQLAHQRDSEDGEMG